MTISEDKLLPYIPTCIAKWHAKHGSSRRHRVSNLKGILLCIDASGFTALTQSLAQHGKSGSEELTLVLNQFFEAMSRAVSPYSGDILKFAGDALWVYMPQLFDPTRFMTRALEELRSVNDNFKDILTDELTIHVGAELGSFQMVSLGESSLRMEIEPLGKLVINVFNLCDKAASDEIAIGPELLNASCQAGTNNFYPIYKINDKDGIENDDPDVEVSYQNPFSLHEYLPVDVVDRLSSSRTNTALQSEHREVVVLFALLEISDSKHSYSSAEYRSLLNQMMIEAFKIIYRAGGSIARVDPYGAGHKLLILFGAPKRHEHDLLHSIVCGIELSKLKQEYFGIKLGLASGPLFCGSVGAIERMEYTVMGEAVNMAARLMSKADNGYLLIDNNTREILPSKILTEKVKLPLKGIGKEVICYKLIGITDANHYQTPLGEIIGQDNEVIRLNEYWEKTGFNSGFSVHITGSAGVGKSHLIEQFIKTNCKSNHAEVYIPCKEALLYGRGWLILEFLKRLLSDKIKPFTNRELSEFLIETIDIKWLPLFNGMTEKDLPDNEWTKGISPALRLKKSLQLLMKILNKTIINKKFLILDDYHLADEFSISLIDGLINQADELSLLLILITRDLSAESEDAKPKHIINISNPTLDEWQGYFTTKFKPGIRENELLKQLLKVSASNPQFIMSAITQWEKTGLISLNNVTGLLELSDTATEIKMPENLHGLCLEEFDCLPEKDREILKTASVIGIEFSMNSLSALLPDRSSKSINAAILRLVNCNYLLQKDESVRFCFKQNIMHDAIYNCIPGERLNELHGIAADILEPIYKVTRPDLIAYHNNQANRPTQAFTWALKAAIKATNAHSLVEAAQLFKLCDNQLKKVEIISFANEELLIFFRKSGEAHLIDSRMHSAYSSFRRWRHFAKSKNLSEEYFLAAIETSRLMWRQSKYVHCNKLLSLFLDQPVVKKHKNILAAAYTVMAELKRRLSNFTEAQEYCNQAIKYAQTTGNIEIQADAYNKLGLAYWGAGELEKASESYIKSLEHKESINGKYAQAQADNNLGIIFWEMGHLNKAANHLTKSLDTFKEIGDERNEAYSSGNLANIYRISGKYKRSELLLKAADLIFEKLNDSHAHQYTVGNLGDLSLVFGNLHKARNSFNEASAFAESIGDKELAAECLVRLAEVSFFEMDYPTARKLYNEGVGIASSIGSQEYIIRAKIGLARLAIGEKHPDEAWMNIQNVLEIAETSKAILALKEALFLKGEFHRISEEFDKASDCYLEVLQYSTKENILELSLKSSVRLIEVGKSTQLATESFYNIKTAYIEENGEKSWKSLMQSAYFSFFIETISKLEPESAYNQ